MAGGNFTRGFAAREFPCGLRQGGDMAALPLARSRIPPATQASDGLAWMVGLTIEIKLPCVDAA